MKSKHKIKSEKELFVHSPFSLVNLFNLLLNIFSLVISYVLSKIFFFLFPSFATGYDKISLKFRKNAIFEKVIPEMYKIGFIKPPFNCSFGWIPEMQGYCYDLVKFKGNKLQIIEFRIYNNRSRIEIHEFVCNIVPKPSNLNDSHTINHLCEFHKFKFEALACERWRFLYPFKFKFRWKNRRYLEWKKNRLAKKIIKFLSSDKPIKYWNKHRYTETLDWNGNVVVAAPPEYRHHKRWINQPDHTDSSNM